ncbi:helix-turn-helix domain-containing protein [Phytoactinopolyspora mesophila]|uniref:Helix-turn-helix domain-containing protein n=1 Tax=Phytoactinopolyspora mesophila TaxID=2650750 RepID=A0A7K3MCN8_9ACTN|nr:helix-turn-helix transcriptional regulator [Phytoactinopolyspora mesophila]NDL61085.1 hypothetical protein [Phytoactinopolyspora mesophila]
MTANVPPPIGQIIRSARHKLGMSQYTLAHELATISGRPTMGRDRVARWERGRQVPRTEWRLWLSAVLKVPPEQLDAGAAAARRLNRLGNAAGATAEPETSSNGRRMQGTPALLPVFRSRVAAGVLAAVLLNPTRAFSLTELADHAGASLASVSKEAQLLADAGILITRNDGAIRLTQAAADKPILGPLTELIRLSYGVPQVIGEEFGQVSGIARIALTSTWAERFAGIPGPEPDNIQVRLTVHDGDAPSRDALRSAAKRAEKRLKRPVRYRIVSATRKAGASGSASHHRLAPGIPQQHVSTPVVHVRPTTPPDGLPAPADPPHLGFEVINRLVDDGELEMISGQAADGTPYFDHASHHLSAADHVSTLAPASAFILVCQSARLIGAGLLAAQGLRLSASADRASANRAVVAQLGTQFEHLELLRRRLLTLDNPIGRDNQVSAEDVEALVPTVRFLLKEACDRVHELGLYT